MMIKSSSCLLKEFFGHHFCKQTRVNLINQRNEFWVCINYSSITRVHGKIKNIKTWKWSINFAKQNNSYFMEEWNIDIYMITWQIIFHKKYTQFGGYGHRKIYILNLKFCIPSLYSFYRLGNGKVEKQHWWSSYLNYLLTKMNFIYFLKH